MTTSGGRRDLADLPVRVAAWADATRPDLAGRTVLDLRHPSAGLSNETVIVRFGPSARDGEPIRVVLRLPPLVPSFPDQDFATQARVQAAVAEAGIPTAGPITLEEDASWLGVPFIVMPFVDGTIPGPASLFDPWLTEATPQQRRDAQREMVRTLAAIHRLDWRAGGIDRLVRGGEGALRDEVTWWGEYLAWATGDAPLPRIQAVLDWCRATCPTREPPASLLWGDPRLENLVMDGDRHVRVVLDWELATIGPAEADLGWYLGLERVLHALVGMEPLAGFAPHDEVVADLGAALGRPLEHVAWHEIFAVARSICINVRQAAISAEAGVRYLLPAGEQNPLLPVVEGWIAAY